MFLLLILQAWRDSSAEQATPGKEGTRSLLPSPPLALTGRGSLGLGVWLSPRGGLLAAAGGGAGAPPPLHCGGGSSARTVAEPGWGAHGAALELRGLSAVEAAAAAAASSLPPLPFGLSLSSPSFPRFFGRRVSPAPPTEEL